MSFIFSYNFIWLLSFLYFLFKRLLFGIYFLVRRLKSATQRRGCRRCRFDPWVSKIPDPLEEHGSPLQYIFARELWIKNPGRLQSIVSQESNTAEMTACKTVLIVTNFPSFSLPRNIFTKPSFLKHIFSKYTVYFFVGRYLLFVSSSGRHWFVWSFLDETSCRPYLISR